MNSIILYDCVPMEVRGQNNLVHKKNLIVEGAKIKPKLYELCPPSKCVPHHDGTITNNVLQPKYMTLSGSGEWIRLQCLKLPLEYFSSELDLIEVTMLIKSYEITLDVALSTGIDVENTFTQVVDLVQDEFPTFSHREYPYENLYVHLKRPRTSISAPGKHCNQFLKIYMKTLESGKNILRIEWRWSYGHGDEGYVPELVLRGRNRRCGRGSALYSVKRPSKLLVHDLNDMLEHHSSSVFERFYRLPALIERNCR
jgi:hypothetical protein